MKIAPVNVNSISINSPNKNVIFRSANGAQVNYDKNDDDKYVKVSKSEYNLNKWSWRILGIITIIEFIHFLVTKKTKPWEGIMKGLK